MTRYLIGLAAVIAVAAGVYFLVPSAPPEPPTASAPEPAPAPTAESAPEPAPEPTPALEGDALLEQIASARREGLPRAVGDDITFTDAVFLPRMRIMEHVFVADRGGAPTAAELRRRVDADTQRLCTEEQALFAEDVTLRHSYRNRDGTLLQRVHLLPETCLPRQ